jgi:hypothetical protein
MVGDEKKEKPSGVINGFNTTFNTSLPYAPGTLFIYLNGMLIKQNDDDGPTETSPSTGAFTLGVAPSTNDVVHVRYIEA